MTMQKPTQKQRKFKDFFNHDPKYPCMYCLGERATVNFSGPKGRKMFNKNKRHFPSLGCDGLTVILDNVLGPLPQMRTKKRGKK